MGTTDKIAQIGEAAEAALQGAILSPERAASFLNDAGPEVAQALRSAASRITERFHGRRIRLFAPLYYANVCVNNCPYCGFRRENRDARRRVLAPEEIEEEAVALLGMGHRRILLVASEDPSRQGRELELEAVRRVRAARANGQGVEQIGIEVAPGEAERFRNLAAAGVDSYLLFQETYDRRLYALVHPDGPKSDFDWRLGAPERALTAGIPHVGLGILLGLGDPLEEMLAVIAHAHQIKGGVGRWPRTISLPRMEPAVGSELSRHPYREVSDEQLLRMIGVIRIALPWVGVVLSARERAEFRDRALDWGITEMSAGSRTEPGGYTAREGGALAQFEVQDHRNLDSVAAVLRARGYDPYTGGDPRPMRQPALS